MNFQDFSYIKIPYKLQLKEEIKIKIEQIKIEKYN